jgi:tRNA (guanine-N7-)-methyltransferase
MKPKNLKCPFTWEERRPLLFQRVLFVPEYYQRHEEWTFPGWEDPSLFGNAREVFVEFCSGHGHWIIEKAKAHPEQNWVAVEMQFERVRKIWSKMQNNGLSNLLIVCGEALTFAKHYLPDSAVQAIYINFPDPWPKTKHVKHRLLQPPFVHELARIAKPSGTATLVSDDVPYCQQMSQQMLQHSAWSPVFPEPYYVTEWADYGYSFFDHLWREKGRTIHYLHFEKKS